MVDPSPAAAACRLSIAARAPSPLSVLRLHRPSADLLERVESIVGPLPHDPRQPSRWPDAPVWLAPGEWLVAAETESFRSRLAPMCEDALFHVANVGDGHVEFLIEGPDAADLLATGCSIDLHPRAFPAGSVSRTLVAGTTVLVIAVEGGAFRLFCDVSHQAYLTAWLDDAALGFAWSPID